MRTYHTNRKWGLIWMGAAVITCLEVWFASLYGYITIGLIVSVLLGAIFGIYYCFFVKEKLPACYDEKRISIYTDGYFRKNFPGLYFNNHNWGKILNVGRIWALSVMVGYPVVSYLETLLFTGLLRDMVDLFVTLLLTVGGFFIPMYIVGKKYES